MTIEIVLFEDQTWKGLRPVCDGLPTYELRCGMFNTRERLELAGGRGVALCRTLLEPLHGDVGWQLGSSALKGADPGPRLWLAGRLAPSMRLVKVLLDLASEAQPFACWDDDGLVTALLDPARGGPALEAWQSWRDDRTGRWDGPDWGPDRTECRGAPGIRIACPASAGLEASGRVLARLEEALAGAPPALCRSWDLVSATAGALQGDLQAAVAAGSWSRRPFGLFPVDPAQAPWAGVSEAVRRGQPDLPSGAWLRGDDLWCAAGVAFSPGAVIDTRNGPVILDNGCEVAPHTLLEGPLYLGPGCRVKSGARIYGESSFGIGNRLAGEIAEATFGDFTNKQHEGFIGHAVVGSWVNLGAMTTCSDLKNNYGNVRVDLGDGAEDTGLRFVGLLAGDHVKTAIGTLLNTGTVVGYASNIFGAGMPPKRVPAFSWGGGADAPAYGVAQAVATASVVMDRRRCRFLPAHRALFEALAGNA